MGGCRAPTMGGSVPAPLPPFLCAAALMACRALMLDRIPILHGNIDERVGATAAGAATTHRRRYEVAGPLWKTWFYNCSCSTGAFLGHSPHPGEGRGTGLDGKQPWLESVTVQLEAAAGRR